MKFSLTILIVPAAFLMLTACHNHSAARVTDASVDSILHTAAIFPFTDSIKQFPDSPRYYFARSSLLYSIRQYGLSKLDLEKAIRLNPREPAYFYGLGEVNMASGKPSAAKNNFEQALALNHRNIQIRLELASALFRLRNYPLALSELDTLLTIDPHVPEANGLKSQIYQELHDTASAIIQLRAAISEAPANFEALMALGDLLREQGKTAALQWYHKAFLTDTTRADALYGEAQFYESAGKSADAVKLYRRCIDIDHYFADAYINLGNIYKTRGDWKKAWDIFNLATKAVPTSSEAFYQRGVCSEKRNNRRQAVEDYSEALALDKNNAAARAALTALSGKR